MVFWRLPSLASQLPQGMCVVRDCVGAGLLAMAILITPMQQAGFGGVLEIAIASKPAPTGDGSVDYAGAVATMSSIEAPASALRR
jgi:hypothetical protein